MRSLFAHHIKTNKHLVPVSYKNRSFVAVHLNFWNISVVT